MQRQGSFADLEASGQRRRTRRERFLEQMEAIVPWREWVAPVESHYPDGRRGRRPVGCERMPGMYLLQVWFHLSDEACEDAVPGPGAMQRFVGIDMMSEQVPDATTLLKFRHLLEGEGLGEGMLAELVSILDERGIIMRGGSIVDATFVESPSSTKNRERSRDPEAHQAKKGNNWHFGHEAHAGVDAGTGLARTVEVTAANVSDVAVAPSLLRPDDEFCHAGAGHAGARGRQQAPGHPDPSEVTRGIARRRSKVPGRDHPEVSWERGTGSSLSRVRSKVEHPFHVIKDLFGPGRTRYRGLEKNRNQLCVAFALADLALLAQAGRTLAPTCA